jgi:hypothetical protein
VGAKCWDQIAEGYLTPNTGRCEGRLLKDDGAKNTKVSTTQRMVINALGSLPGGIPRGLFIGVVRGSGNNV